MATSETGPDTWRAKFTQMMHSTYTIFGMALGNELGLIQAMGELDKPVTATELAEKTDCKERYVREWLMMMAMTDVLEMDDSATRFSLPQGFLEELSEEIKKSAWIPVFGVIHQHLVKAFRSSGPRGVPKKYGKLFQEAFDHYKETYWLEMCPMVAGAMPGLQARLDNSGEFLDIGCSTGVFSMTMAGLYPRSTFYGVDISHSDILTACQTVSSTGTRNVRFEEADAARLPVGWSNKFDAVFMFDSFHDIPFANKTCEEIHRVLKPEGFCIIVDVDIPSDPLEQNKNLVTSTELYAFSRYYCLSQSMNTEGSEALGTGVGLQRIAEMVEKASLKRVSEGELSLPENYKYILVFRK